MKAPGPLARFLMAFDGFLYCILNPSPSVSGVFFLRLASRRPGAPLFAFVVCADFSGLFFFSVGWWVPRPFPPGLPRSLCSTAFFLTLDGAGLDLAEVFVASPPRRRHISRPASRGGQQ